MSRRFKNSLTLFNVFLGLILLLNLFAFAAPVLLELGLETPAKYIYIVYSFFCHQIHYRSLHLFDHQLAWCTRDTFIWLGLLFAGIFVKYRSVRPLKWYEVMLFVIPIALDGGIQLIATMLGFTSDGDVFYVSTNLSRMLTGGFFGMGLGLWIFPMLREFDEVPQKIKKVSLRRAILVLYASMFVLYIMLVGLWGLTSSSYKPNNFLDSHERLPEDKDMWLVRRKNAVCETNATEGGFFDFDCD